MPLSTTSPSQYIGLFLRLMLFILMELCLIGCLGRGWGYFFYFDFGLFYKVTGLIFTQVKAHKGS